jgi:hypothetical protein
MGSDCGRCGQRSRRRRQYLCSIRSEGRQQQVKPFLEQLVTVITDSYAVAQIPPQYVVLLALMPQLRKHVDMVVGKWHESMHELSQRRVQLFIALDADQVRPIAELLAKMVLKSRELPIARTEYLASAERGAEKLQAVHSDLVTIGYRLLLEIAAALHAPVDDNQQKQLDIDPVVPLLEHGGVTATPWGSSIEPSWLAIWQLDISPEVSRAREERSGTSDAAFDVAVLKFAQEELYRRPDVIDGMAHKIDQTRGEDADQAVVRMLAIAITFDSAQSRNEFLGEPLRIYRRQFRSLWSAYRTPIEITVD